MNRFTPIDHILDATLKTMKDHVSSVDGYTCVTELNGQLDMSGKYQDVEPKEYHQHSKEFVKNLVKEFVACVESEMKKRFSPWFCVQNAIQSLKKKQSFIEVSS
ncbi:hypothetical protein ACJMK2_040796 [Sinanodonta woodiana]|uniref:Uncharacterized protein n=1 Tax=Sinanodonta woodiana TaxID=1069815 RepID=A0ABD3W253_SINWO